MTSVISEVKKKLAGRRANQLARRLADTVRKLRIVHCSRQDHRADQGRRGGHRLVVGCTPAPFGELALDEANEVLDAPAGRTAHFRLLARHLAPCGGDRAAVLW